MATQKSRTTNKNKVDNETCSLPTWFDNEPISRKRVKVGHCRKITDFFNKSKRYFPNSFGVEGVAEGVCSSSSIRRALSDVGNTKAFFKYPSPSLQRTSNFRSLTFSSVKKKGLTSIASCSNIQKACTSQALEASTSISPNSTFNIVDVPKTVTNDLLRANNCDKTVNPFNEGQLATKSLNVRSLTFSSLARKTTNDFRALKENVNVKNRSFVETANSQEFPLTPLSGPSSKTDDQQRTFASFARTTEHVCRSDAKPINIFAESSSQDLFSNPTPASDSDKQKEGNDCETLNKNSGNVCLFFSPTLKSSNISQDLFSSSDNSASQENNKNTPISSKKSLEINEPRVSHHEEQQDFETAGLAEWKLKLLEGMQKIKEAEALAYEKLFENTSWHIKQDKQAVLSKISAILVESEETGIIKCRSKSYSNCVFSENSLMMKPFETAIYSFITRNNRITSPNFHLIRILLAKIKSLMESKSTVTQRELYYQNLNFAKNANHVTRAMVSISRILNVGPWELGVFSTSKGLVYGDLQVRHGNGEILNCYISGGVLVPQNVDGIVQIESQAEFIIVVEKDTIFQKLLDENFRKHLPLSFILITGKGYPDANTRLFLNKLYAVLKIPVFVLVDANPFGIDIMLTYKLGALTMAHLSHQLTLPNLHWLGIFPSEITTLNLVKQKLTETEMVTIERLLQRDYMPHFPKIQQELCVLRSKGVKSEIEGVMKSDEFLSRVYLPMKFYNRDYL